MKNWISQIVKKMQKICKEYEKNMKRNLLKNMIKICKKI